MPAVFFVFVLYCSRLFVSLQQKTNSLNCFKQLDEFRATHSDKSAGQNP